ncbi:hypothetical protein KKG41_06040 [Patescibacteria group bacterium]|nr:hypothetical protein [Patescibacteria group bacterium]MBU1890166.1 hypothetical protein [Patescibacteria group bacterium]
MKNFLEFILLTAIGLVIIIFVDDIKWFLFYFFLCVLWVGFQISRQVEFNRKMLRVTRVGNDVKLLALAEALKVSREDMKKIFSNMKQNTDKKDIESLKKDTRDVTGAIIVDDLEL